MALSAKLQVRQSQSLVMTPQLMQAIRLLQMSGPELERFLESEVEQNPLLDRPEAPADEDRVEAPAPDLDGAADDFDADWRVALAASTEPRATARSGTVLTLSGPAQGKADPLDAIGERSPAAPESLIASLERQIDVAFRLPAERAIALALLAALDPAGYLTLDLNGLAERLGARVECVASVLARCRALEPAGMFARSLAECLALQLEERNRLDPAMRKLLDRLDLVAASNFNALSLHCGVDMEDLAGMVAEIRSLDPKPGLSRSSEPLRPIIPDAFVRPAPNCGWSVELNEAALPRLLIDRRYFAEVAPRLRHGDDKRFLVDCLQKASWLEKSLDQRARTILKVAVEIVRQQDAFLHDGVARLRPLNLRMVADAIGMHESTVSRATANKYLATPRGIFEFRYFFSSAIQASAGGEAHSAEAVKHRIRALIGNERPEAVLSDDALVDLLSAEGIDVARRTVAKYRDMLRIGSSVDRRRRNKLLARPELAARTAPRPAV